MRAIVSFFIIGSFLLVGCHDHATCHICKKQKEEMYASGVFDATKRAERKHEAEKRQQKREYEKKHAIHIAEVKNQILRKRTISFVGKAWIPTLGAGFIAGLLLLVLVNTYKIGQEKVNQALNKSRLQRQIEQVNASADNIITHLINLDDKRETIKQLLMDDKVKEKLLKEIEEIYAQVTQELKQYA